MSSASSPWPFARLDVVSIVPVRLAPSAARSQGGAPEPVAETSEVQRDDGGRDVRTMTLQHGPALAGTPTWCTGPAPFAVDRSVTDDTRYAPFHSSAGPAEREGYASPMLRDRLYAPEHRCHRAGVAEDQVSAWAAHAGHEHVSGDPHVIALELIRFTSVEGAADGVLLIHARPPLDQADPLEALRLLTLRTEASRPWIEHLLRGVGALPRAAARPYHLCLAQPREQLGEREGKGWTAEERWMWLLATLQDARSYPVSEQNRRQLRDATQALSGDWACVVMRTGTTFLARPLADDWLDAPAGERRELAYLAEMAPLLVRSLYADAVAFGVVKGIMLHAFAQRLAALGDPTRASERLVTLDSAFTTFRNTLWWQDAGLSGHATMLLRKYDGSHNHRAAFDRLVADFSDYSQKVERAELQRGNELSQGTNALVGLVTCFGVPLGILQVFGTHDGVVWVFVGAYLAALSLLPAGDQIIGLNIPQRWRSEASPGGWARAAWATFWIALIGVLLLTGALPLPESG